MRPSRVSGRSARAAVLGWALAAALASGAPQPEPTPHSLPEPEADRERAAEFDRIGPALDKRIRGKASLDDVRVDVTWARGGPMSSTRVYGNGVGIWDRRSQFRLTKPQVVAILKALRQARFGAMPDVFGEEEEGEEREQAKGEREGPRMKGRIDARAGTVSKTVIQMVDGDQSAELAALAERLLALCAEPARSGVGAKNLGEGLQKVAAGRLAPETLSATVQRRFERADPATGETGWILQLEGRVAVSESLPGGRKNAPRMELALTESEFRGLTGLLAGNRAAELPINVYAPEYTDLQLAVLSSSRTISARRYLQMTPDTHGEAQKTFERIYDAFRALNARARKDGKALPARPAAEREEEKEKREKD